MRTLLFVVGFIYSFHSVSAMRAFTPWDDIKFYDCMVEAATWSKLPQEDKNVALFSKIDNRDLYDVAILVAAGADVNASAIHHNQKPLHRAVYNERLVSFLIMFGADYLALDDEGHTPFHWAAIDGNVSVLKLFLKLGVPAEIINKQNKFGNTPLSDAVINKHVEVVRFLLENGAQPSLTKTDNWGYSPLKYAQPGSEIYLLLTQHN